MCEVPVQFYNLLSLELHPILPVATPLALLALWLAFLAVTPHAAPTNGKAYSKYELKKYEKITDSWERVREHTLQFWWP